MTKLRLETPGAEHKEAVMDFRQEFLAARERVSRGVGLELADTYERWLTRSVVPHYGKVEEAVFLAFDQGDNLVGISDIRLQTNETISAYAGQIGYSVRPSQRNKGYASEILRLTLGQAAGLGFSQVLITCNEPNTASAKVIERNGGRLEAVIPHPGYPNVKRYWVETSRG